MAMSPSGGKLYVCDAKGGQIWELDCSSASGCSDPSAFATTAVVAPSSIAVTEDGTVWVGDLEAEKVLSFSSSGEVKQVIDRMSPE